MKHAVRRDRIYQRREEVSVREASLTRAAGHTVDPLAASPWSAPATVAGFAKSAPNPVLMRYAEQRKARTSSACALDLGCGAGRNAVPLARTGWDVVGTVALSTHSQIFDVVALGLKIRGLRSS